MERHSGIQASAECDSTMQTETFFISSLLFNRRLEMKKALNRGKRREHLCKQIVGMLIFKG
jgi:hypothetical protein